MFKNMRLVILFDMFLKPSFKMMTSFTNIARTAASTSKDPISNDLDSFLVYKFTCASCSFSNIGKTCCHFKTRTEKHIKKDNKSYIFKHLHSTATCFDSYNSPCFKIIHKANSKFDLKIKEALHINWRKLKCTTKSFSSHPFTIAFAALAPFCLCFFFFCFFVVVFFGNSLSSIVFIISTLIIRTFYHLSFTLLLLFSL